MSTNYSIEQGLPSSETYDVLQDPKGFIWIATDRGVCRFDGFRFKVFTTENGLTDNTVFNLGLDDKGRVWFLPLNGKLCFFDGDTIRPFRYNDLLSQRLSKARIARTFSCLHDTITIGYLFNGIVTIYPDGKLIEDPVPMEGRSSVFVAADKGKAGFAMGMRSNMPVPGQNGTDLNLLQFIRNGQITSVENTRVGQVQANVAGVKRKNGSCLVYLPNFLAEFSASNVTATYPMDGDEIIRMFEDDDSCLWVSFKKKGTRRYSPNEPFSSGLYTTYLKGQVVSGFCEDREKGFWLTTLEHGVFYVPSVKYQFYTADPFPGEQDAVTVTGDGKRVIYSGFKRGPLCSISAGHGDNPVIQPLGLSDRSIYSTAYDTTSGSLWVGSSDGLTIFRGQGDPVRVFEAAAKSISINYQDSTLWTWSIFELIQFQLREPWKLIRRIPISFRGDAVCCLSDGRVLLGSNDGLYEIGKDFHPKKNEQEELRDVRISSIREKKDGRLVLSTIGKGIVIMGNGKMENLSVKEGVCSNIITGLAVEGETIWAATNKGLSRILLSQGAPVIDNFSTADGLPTDELRKVWVQAGKVCIATSKGLVIVDEDMLSTNSSFPGVYISNIQLPDRTIKTHNGDTINLNYNEDQLTVDFAGLSYKMRGKVKYRYMMKGLHSDWQYTGNNTVQFTSLDPGSYRLEVYAQNERGIWSNNPAVLWLEVRPPYWSTWWFISLMSLTVICLVATLISTRIRQLKNRNRIMEQLHNYRIQALSMQMNPHFIFNSLNSIQAFVLTEDKKNATRYLNKFSKLMRMELNSLRKEYVSIADELEMLESYLELEEIRFRNRFTFVVHAGEEVQREQLLIPSMLIQPYVENSIKHGVIPKQGPGLISVLIGYEDGLLCCTVEDDGVGRDHSVKKKEEKHDSAGMFITEQRLRLLCSNNNQPFFLEITDKKDSSGAGIGTIVKFTLPYRKDEKGNQDTNHPRG